MVRRWDLHGLVPCLCCSYHRCLRSGEFVRLIGEVHKTFLNHYCFINVCIHTCFLWVCVCKLVSCSHSILLEQIAETFSADLIFLFSPGHQGMIHKSLDKFTRYIFFIRVALLYILLWTLDFRVPYSLSVTQIDCRWAGVISPNTCHAGARRDNSRLVGIQIRISL